MADSFSQKDLDALLRALEVRATAHALVKDVQDLLPTLFAPDIGLRVSRVREDFDRVGLFFFVPKLGNIWCGVPLAGTDTLHLVVQVPAESVDPLRALGAGMVLEAPSYVGKVALLDAGAPDQLRTLLKVSMNRWLGAL